jgi:hypothetical protein
LLAARLLKSTTEAKKGKAKKAGITATPLVSRTRSEEKENAAPKEKAKRIAVA